jgi:hypothetical protein
VVQADHYIVSITGAIFHHSDDEAISPVIVYGSHHPRLWFNFDSDRSRRWAHPALRNLHGYDVTLPADDRGLSLALLDDFVKDRPLRST